VAAIAGIDRHQLSIPGVEQPHALVDDPRRGLVLGFQTGKFVHDGARRRVSVYVPTNHIYIGDIQISPADVVSYPDLTVQEGVQIFITGAMALSEIVRSAEREG